MKILRNKFLIGLLCIAIGVTVGFVLLPKSQNMEVKTVQVVRLKQDIPAGTPLEKEMMEVVALPEESTPNGASAEPESFLNRYSSSRLYAGDILTAAKVRDTLMDPVAAAAAKGKQLVSVTVPTLSAGVSGTLQPGDVVSVMVTNKVTQFNSNLGLLTATEPPEGALISGISKESQTYIPAELRYLEVCKVSSSDGTDALVNGQKDAEQPNRLPVTITFYATEEQALKLAEVEQTGELHVTFVARGDDADAFIPRSERVLAGEIAPEETASSEGSPQPVVSATPSTSAEPAASQDAPVDMNDPEVGE